MEKVKKAIDLTGLALAVIVMAVVVSVGATILLTQRDARLDQLETVSTANEVLTTVDEAGETLAHIWVKSVDVSLEGKNAQVVFDNEHTRLSDLESVIVEEGYEVNQG